MLTEDAIVVVKGRVDRRDDIPKFIATDVRCPEISTDGDGPPLRLRMQASRFTVSLVDEVKRLLGNHPGSSPVFIHLEDGRQTTVLRLGPEWCVDPRGGLHGELRVLLGADAVF